MQREVRCFDLARYTTQDGAALGDPAANKVGDKICLSPFLCLSGTCEGARGQTHLHSQAAAHTYTHVTLSRVTLSFLLERFKHKQTKTSNSEDVT